MGEVKAKDVSIPNRNWEEMAKRDTVRISGSMIEWARERADLGREALADKLGYSAQQVEMWEKDFAVVSYAQAERIAEALSLPFGMLFMSAPPELRLPIADLRTFDRKQPKKPSLHFLQVLNDCVIRQRWFREDQISQGQSPLPFVGQFRLGDNIVSVAKSIAGTLGVSEEMRRDCPTWEAFLSEFVTRAESAGILVMRSSVVRHISRYGLSVREFRGFAMSDPYAPLVFINSKDARSAQIFTLAHEIAHIWIGESGISNPNPKKRSDQLTNVIEQYCNKVAAELLVPAHNVLRLWNSSRTPEENIQRLATFHRVSRTVAVIRAREMQKINDSLANKIIEDENRRFAAQKEKAKEHEGGPSFWASFAPRNSVRLMDAVIAALRQERVFYRDAATLLGTKVGTLQRFLARSEAS